MIQICDDFSNKTRLPDLNSDCQLLILEDLDVHSLLKISQTSKQFNHLAIDVYRRKYSKKMFRIKTKWYSTDEDVIVTDDSISITSSSVAVEFLEVFGPSMIKLTVHYALMDADEATVLARNINKHCSDSLLHIEFYASDENVWKEMQDSFRKVENVSFIGRLETDYRTNFTVIFPNVRCLILRDIFFVNEFQQRNFNMKFPQLEYLSVEFSAINTDNSFSDKEFEMFTQTNSHIRSLKLLNVSEESLKIAIKNLQNLESLNIVERIQKLKTPKEAMHFENVKKLSLDIDGEHVPNWMTFSKVEELDLTALYSLTDEWIDYITQSNTLRKLKINNQITDQIISKLSQKPLNLIEMSLNIAADVESETIFRLIEQCATLKSIYVMIVKRNIADKLQEALGNTWQRNEHDFQYFIFERYL